VGSAAIAREIAELERELANLRTQADEDRSSFTALEQQISELRDSLTQTHDTVRIHELRLAEKKVALAAAERLEHLEAYGQDLEKYREARKRVADAAASFLAELDGYDGEVVSLRQLLDEMRSEFGVEDERVAEVEAALGAESQELNGSWQAVGDATKWRVAEPPEPEYPTVPSGGEIAEDLQKRAEDHRVSRIREYFTKT
jgi:chromosome segregation ATPase